MIWQHQRLPSHIRLSSCQQRELQDTTPLSDLAPLNKYMRGKECWKAGCHSGFVHECCSYINPRNGQDSGHWQRRYEQETGSHLKRTDPRSIIVPPSELRDRFLSWRRLESVRKEPKLWEKSISEFARWYNDAPGIFLFLKWFPVSCSYRLCQRPRS